VNVTLRPVEAGDLPVFYDHQRDPEGARRVGWVPRDRAAFDTHWAKVLADPANLLRTVLVDGAVAGSIMSWTNGDRREVGYWLGNEFWGRGVGTVALRAYLDVETHRPLYADPIGTNAASIALLRRCGFVDAGRDGEHVVLVKED
jgi:RimJ/RimL family protein N-acetyltransferase